MSAAPWFWIIGGPNGAGKTTFCLRFLPAWVKTFDYVNADLIAAGLYPLDPSREPVAAGKVMLRRIAELVDAKRTFAVESTLSSHTFLKLARKLKSRGWKIGVAYVWLASDAVAIKRVQERVKVGGHSVPETTIRRRRSRGLRSLSAHLDLADRWMLFDNSGFGLEPVAGSDDKGMDVFNATTLNLILPGIKL